MSKLRALVFHPVAVIFLMLFLVACGSPQPAADSAEEQPAALFDEPVSLENVGEDAQETRATDVPSNTEMVEASASLDVEPGTLETDAGGLTVGFTPEGFAFRGDPSAPILMEEFSDFQCPFCGRFYEQTLPSLLEEQIAEGEVVLLYYDFPLNSIHPQAEPAARAAHCAGESGAAAYWAMHDLLFERIGEWSGKNNVSDYFVDYAGELDLGAEEMASCLESGRHANRVQSSIEAGMARGVNSTPSFFLNDQPLTGAQPLSTFNEAIATLQEGGELASNQPPTPAPQAAAAAPTPAALAPEYAAARGNPDAPVTIVEFTDYQCPYCARYADETMPQLLEEYVETGEVYYILKDLPLDSIHPVARAAAVAARCAGDQDAYWEMHDALFENQARWSEQVNNPQDEFETMAAELNLDESAFSACLDSGRYEESVEANAAEAAALGITGTPFFFMDGYPIPGAQPFELFEFAIGYAQEGRLAEAYEPQPQPTAPPTPSGPADIDIGDAPTLGDPDAPVVIVEFTDFQCPYCSRHFEQTFPQIRENYIESGQVLYVFKDFPLTNIHPQAVKAAEAAHCADAQGAFIEMHDSLFARQGEWSGKGNAPALFVGYAEDLGLDTDEFAECLDSGRHEERVMADLQEGISLGITGTPGFFINGFLLSGAQPYPVFEQSIQQFLTE